MGPSFNMADLVMVIVIAVFPVSLSIQLPCPTGGCPEAGYLGSSWGPGEEPVSRDEAVWRKTSDEMHQRPFLPSSRVSLDMMDSPRHSDQSSASLMNTPVNDSRWQTYTYGDINDLFEIPNLNLSPLDIIGGFIIQPLNLSSLGTTGVELQARLWRLNRTVSSFVNKLFLENNNIQFLPVLTFPVWMEYGLSELRLDHNPLVYLSTYTRFELSRLANLKVLSLARTGLRYLDSLYLPNLKVLDLSNNRLSTVSPSLSSLQHLEQLHLAGNEIQEVSAGPPLTDLPNLWLLSLENNRITHVLAKSLYNVMVYLNDNYLESLSEVKDTGVTAVNLNGNPWQCSCPLLDAVHKNYPQIIVGRQNLTCNIGENQYLAMDLTKKDVQLDCPQWWDFLKAEEKRVEVFMRYSVLPRHMTWSTILTGLGWLTFILAVFLLTRSLRRLKKKRDLQQMPYCNLNDKNFI